MIEKLPIELEPPSPFPSPPLRKRPSISPQFSTASHTDPSRRLFIDERWN
ncbi:MAG: hypothetical protein LBH74_08505 [Nitrososphaerota archaeon]|nr:hypothetical protein [Candidatus Termitimicrobium sp.]MCL2430950.1 hypothetical protein [Candidatus Termitimicrobium sp.]MDR0493658.1 hypothetical protein [Nitrososphaerota archaeon]